MKYSTIYKILIFGFIFLTIIGTAIYVYINVYLVSISGKLNTESIPENKIIETQEEVLVDLGKRPVDVTQSQKIVELNKIKVNTSLSAEERYDILNALNKQR